MTIRVFDSLINFLSGLGTSRDKAVNATFIMPSYSTQQLEAAYRGDWIARKIVDIPAMDATRAWRAWQADEDQIEKLEEAERLLDVRAKVRRAMILARLYGGAAIVLGTDQGDSAEELVVDKVRLGSLKFIHSVSRHGLTAGQIEANVLSPFYGQPSYYERQGPMGPTRIHPSRVIRLLGSDLPDPSQSNDGWGDSALAVVMDAVVAAGSVAGAIASLVQEAKVDFIKIPELSARLTTAEYENQLTRRFAYSNSSKSINNTYVMDKEDEWDRVQTNFSTLPDVLRMYLLIASGAADIPATRMLGQSPAGLSATGESDIRNYYDRVSSDQEVYLTPSLSTLDEVLIRSTLSTRDPSIHYLWNPLWQMDEVQKAALAKQKADTHKVDVDLGLISPEALREGRKNQLVEDGFYPGFEAALEEFPDKDLDEVDPAEELALEKQRLELEQQRQGQSAVPLVPGQKPDLKVVGRDAMDSLTSGASFTWDAEHEVLVYKPAKAEEPEVVE